MAVYAIGDVQGCYSALCRLLEHIKFDQASDQLWFCGDLVNRGPESLQTLRFVRSLGENAITVLGNHDLHLLALYASAKKPAESDSLYEVITSPDCEPLLKWLHQQPLAHYDPAFDIIMVHAGVYPDWSVQQTMRYANEVEQVLRNADAVDFFTLMYGNKPKYWSEELTGIARLRCITNIFTRMRYLARDGKLNFKVKQGPDHASTSRLIPWFELPTPARDATRTVFGHWSTLPVGVYGKHYALDQGCVWGGGLTALRIDITKPRWFHIDC